MMNGVVAWIGAATGSASLFWNIYTWLRKGARLSVRAFPNYIVVGAFPPDERTRIFITIANRGDAPTTISAISFMHFDSWWRRWRFRPSNPALLIPEPEGPRLPQKLGPGDEWKASAMQEPIERSVREHGWKNRVYVAVDHSMGRKPHLCKVASGL